MNIDLKNVLLDPNNEIKLKIKELEKKLMESDDLPPLNTKFNPDALMPHYKFKIRPTYKYDEHLKSIRFDKDKVKGNLPKDLDPKNAKVKNYDDSHQYAPTKKPTIHISPTCVNKIKDEKTLTEFSDLINKVKNEINSSSARKNGVKDSTIYSMKIHNDLGFVNYNYVLLAISPWDYLLDVPSKEYVSKAPMDKNDVVTEIFGDDDTALEMFGNDATSLNNNGNSKAGDIAWDKVKSAINSLLLDIIKAVNKKVEALTKKLNTKNEQKNKAGIDNFIDNESVDEEDVFNSIFSTDEKFTNFILDELYKTTKGRAIYEFMVNTFPLQLINGEFVNGLGVDLANEIIKNYILKNEIKYLDDNGNESSIELNKIKNNEQEKVINSEVAEIQKECYIELNQLLNANLPDGIRVAINTAINKMNIVGKYKSENKNLDGEVENKIVYGLTNKEMNNVIMTFANDIATGVKQVYCSIVNRALFESHESLSDTDSNKDRIMKINQALKPNGYKNDYNAELNNTSQTLVEMLNGEITSEISSGGIFGLFNEIASDQASANLARALSTIIDTKPSTLLKYVQASAKRNEEIDLSTEDDEEIDLSTEDNDEMNLTDDPDGDIDNTEVGDEGENK